MGINSAQEETIMDNMATAESPNDSLDKNGINSSSNKANLVTKLVNTLVIVTVGIVTLLLRSDVISVTRRGYFCDDLSIRYPKRPQTVSTKILIIVSSLVAAIIFAIAEYSVIKYRKHPSVTNLNILGKSLPLYPTWIGPLVKLVILYFMGAAANSILTDVTKNVIGWPRPNFIDMCKPNVTCDESIRYEYITDFKCTSSVSEDKFNDAFKSFPSGHASFAAFVAVFIALYVHERFKVFPYDVIATVRPFVQLVVVAIAWWSAMTRVMDNVHHPVDVLAGLCLGSLVAIWCLKHMTDLIRAIDDGHSRSFDNNKYSLDDDAIK
jgi:phosphatidate phosphatase